MIAHGCLDARLSMLKNGLSLLSRGEHTLSETRRPVISPRLIDWLALVPMPLGRMGRESEILSRAKEAILPRGCLHVVVWTLACRC